MKKVKRSDLTDTAEHQQEHQTEVTAQAGEHFGVGTIVSDTFATFFKNWFSFSSIAVLVYLPIVLAMVAIFGFDITNPEAFAAADPSVLVITIIATSIVSMLSLAVMMAAISYGAIEDQAGSRATFGDMLVVGLKNFIPVIAAMVLTTVLYMLGLVLLVVPGIIVMVMLSVTTQVIVAEGKGPIDAMKRSAELTSGYKWPVFGALIVVYIVTQIAVSLLNIPLSLMSLGAATEESIWSISLLVSAILGAVSYAIYASCGASIYTGLRRVKEGVSSEEIAKVFA